MLKVCVWSKYVYPFKKTLRGIVMFVSLSKCYEFALAPSWFYFLGLYFWLTRRFLNASLVWGHRIIPCPTCFKALSFIRTDGLYYFLNIVIALMTNKKCVQLPLNICRIQTIPYCVESFSRVFSQGSDDSGKKMWILK